MKILDSYKVGSQEFKIVFTDTNDLRKGRNNFARADIANNVIYLDKTLPLSQIECSLFHELLHCITSETNLLSELGNGERISEENIVSRVSTLLYQVLKDNKMLK